MFTFLQKTKKYIYIYKKLKWKIKTKQYINLINNIITTWHLQSDRVQVSVEYLTDFRKMG